MQDMSSFTISAAIGMWRCGAKDIDIAVELNLAVWEVENIIEVHKEKTIRAEVFKGKPVDNEDELFDQDSKENHLI